jgi:hypothetical protein
MSGQNELSQLLDNLFSDPLFFYRLEHNLEVARE